MAEYRRVSSEGLDLIADEILKVSTMITKDKLYFCDMEDAPSYEDVSFIEALLLTEGGDE